MRVTRIGKPPSSGYTRIPNTVTSKRLSLEAVGLYALLASLPPGFTLHLRRYRPWRNGYQATRRALEELAAHGLVSGPVNRRALDGKYVSTLKVYLDPVDNPVDNHVDNPVDNSPTGYRKPAQVTGTVSQWRIYE